MSTTLTPAMKRSALISMLRDPALWPEGFEWNFAQCGSCAIGMWMETTHQESPQESPYVAMTATLMKEFGLSRDHTRAVFGSANGYPLCMSLTDVTPFMVADKLEALHKSMAEAA